MKIIVIGAGIAGLSAAWELHCTGHDVCVLERSGRAGGRLASTDLAGVTIELGAQVLATHARVIPALARRMGLSIRAGSAPSALAGHGRLHPFDIGHPLSLFTSGALSWGSSGRAMIGLSRMRRLGERPTDDLAAWAELESTDARDWCRARFGGAVTGRLLTPAVKAHLQLLDDSSTALAAAVAQNRGGISVTTMDGGLERLPAALADRLDVRFNTPVERVRVVDGRPVVETDTDTLAADRVVLAVAGPEATTVWPDASAEETALMSTPYRPGLVVSLGYLDALAPDALAGAGSVLMPAESDIASVLVASRSGRSASSGDALTAVFHGPAAAALAAAADDLVVERARAAIDELEPGLGAAAGPARVTRWPHATASVPPGHATQVQRYRMCLAPDAPIVLAGDYLGFPWSDSAAGGGIWAARHITGSHRGPEGANGAPRREQAVG